MNYKKTQTIDISDMAHTQRSEKNFDFFKKFGNKVYPVIHKVIKSKCNLEDFVSSNKIEITKIVNHDFGVVMTFSIKDNGGQVNYIDLIISGDQIIPANLLE